MRDMRFGVALCRATALSAVSSLLLIYMSAHATYCTMLCYAVQVSKGFLILMISLVIFLYEYNI